MVLLSSHSLLFQLCSEISSSQVSEHYFKIMRILLGVIKDKISRILVQKRTFTKWINTHLAKVTYDLSDDLFEDIKDGVMLIALLEVLSGQKLVRSSFLLNQGIKHF
uniref:Calponin-homology (CH) domain-containing protein n=1 Tax=Pavo cristatus TaxID=9049 RepID=A0A8C9F0R5_PAVCR